MRLRLRWLRVRVRLRGRGTVTLEGDALARQSARLAPQRERLLRRALPASRGATLDLACGPGTITADLVARVSGPVIALDRDVAALRLIDARAARVRGNAVALPFREGALELVVTQAAWLWFGDIDAAAREAHRVLAPGGALVAVGEPDFGGAIEHPPSLALAPLWEAALRRAGAEPRAGRLLPGALRRAGFGDVSAEIFGEVAAPQALAAARRGEADLLRPLLRGEGENEALEEGLRALAEAGPEAFVHVPFVGLLARR